MNRPKQVLFQAPNGIGLGHLVRLSNISLALRQLDDAIQPIFVVDTAHYQMIEDAGFLCIPVPSPRALKTYTEKQNIPFRSLSPLLTATYSAVLATLEPRLAVFDCLPNIWLVRECINRRIPLALCLREMKDLAAYLLANRKLLMHVSLILIPHEPGVFELPAELRERAHFVGNIIKPFSVRAHSSSEQRSVVVTGGGGGFPGTAKFYNLCLRAIHLSRCCRIQEVKLVVGPLFNEWDQLAYVEGVKVVPFDSKLHETFAEARLVLCQGGYNTLGELATIGTPTICVPAMRRLDDQFRRGTRMAERFSTIRTWQGNNEDDLASEIKEMVSRPPTPKHSQHHDLGNVNAARLLSDYINQ